VTNTIDAFFFFGVCWIVHHCDNWRIKTN